MNAKSVIDYNSKNQADPFDLGDLKEFFVTGVTKMQSRTLSQFAEELVSQYAIFKDDVYDLDLDYLSDSDKFELARLVIESSNRDLSECIYGNDLSINSNFTCALLSMLKENSVKNRENFARIALDNILIYYKEYLQEILDHACDVYYHEALQEQGLRADYDQEHGDIIWRKSA